MEIINQVTLEIKSMSSEDFDAACMEAGNLICEYIETIESGNNLSKLPSRDEISRASLIIFSTLGASPNEKKTHEKAVLEICNFSAGISLVEIAPKIKALYNSAVADAIREYEKRNPPVINDYSDLF